MAAPKKPGVVRHLHIDPYVRVLPDNRSASIDGDKRMDKFLAWWDSLPPRDGTKSALELLIAACNGELGIAHSSMSAVVDEDEQINDEKLDRLLKNMSMDED